MLKAGAPARAIEAYPVRAITLVVPLAPGTTADVLARLFADRLSARLGHQVVVSDRPGAGGLIGAQAVASAPADGYTLLLGNSGLTILAALNKDLPFDPVRGFAGVALIGEAAAIVAVPLSLGPRDLKSFIDLAKDMGKTESDIDLGTVAKAGMIDRAVAEAAFALKEGEVSAPVKGRFDTTICLPNRPDSRSPKSRARKSAVVPGASGTTTVIARTGYGSSAQAGAAGAIMAASAIATSWLPFIAIPPHRCRHCKEVKPTKQSTARRPGLLRCARNDASRIAASSNSNSVDQDS